MYPATVPAPGCFVLLMPCPDLMCHAKAPISLTVWELSARIMVMSSREMPLESSHCTK